jgi:hypothetical protein
MPSFYSKPCFVENDLIATPGIKTEGNVALWDVNHSKFIGSIGGT